MKEDKINGVTVRWHDGYMEEFEATEVRFGCDLLWMRLSSGVERCIPLRSVRWWSASKESHQHLPKFYVRKEEIMAKYRRKPAEVEAIQYMNGNVKECYDFCPSLKYKGQNAIIPTPKGVRVVAVGEYIIKDAKGEFYPCKPDIFEQKYEKINENPSPCIGCGQDPQFCCGCEEYSKWKEMK
jgi:hypothetical protein